MANETLVAAANQTTTLLGHSVPFTGHPALDIFIITLFTSFFVTMINKYFTDQIKIKALRAEMKELQGKMRKEMTKNPKKAQEIQKKIFQKNMENIRHTMKPQVMLLTMFPMLILFIYVAKYYGPLGEFLNLGFTTFGWLGTYLVLSIINSIIMKKVLDVA